MRRITQLIGLCASSAIVLIASPIAGTFNIDGRINVTNTAINWTGNIGPPFAAGQATISQIATGSFAGLSGTTITIQNLNRSTEPAGSSFTDTLYITFDAEPSLPALEINFIFNGLYTGAGCLSTPAAGQTCTPGPPVTPAASPFNFVNYPPPPPAVGPLATATFFFAGETADHLSSWTGNFTSQFNVPFQTVLAAFQNGGSGSVTNTYSATVTAIALPEPSPLVSLCVGLFLVICSAGLRRRDR